jgi:type VI secretion system protein ImpJ
MLSSLVVRFGDGTIVDTDLADNLPPVCDLSGANGSETAECAALPPLSASGGNLDNGQD